MNLKLTRKEFGDTCTLGELFVDGKFFAYTCEDVVRAPAVKVPGQTAIPAGKYSVSLTRSARFKKVLPLLANVPNFSVVRIHSGNTSVDTEGCVLVGLGKENGSITKSRDAMALLMPLLQKATAIQIEII